MIMSDDWQSQRVLKFFDTKNDSPSVLTQHQIQEFNERGYLLPFDICGKAEAERNRVYFDRLLNDVQKEGRSEYSINGYHSQSQEIWDICTHPKILNIIEDLIGPDFVAWGTHYFCKLANDAKSVPWHQDASYWPLTPSKTVTVWLAIDDADRENSAMKVVAGSHRKGHLAFENAQKDEQVVLNQRVIDAEEHGEVAYMEMKAGQISVHSDMLIHGSDANASNRRRCGLTIRYAPVEVRCLHEWNTKSIWCRGEDTTRHWSNLPRPMEAQKNNSRRL